MKYGITLAGIPGAELKGQYAKKAQDEGFNSAWSDDNPGSDGSIHMTSMVKSAPDIRVGSGILRAFLRNPVTIASAFMTMNALSNTNTILGFGTGTKRQNLYQYGIEINKPISQLRSVIGIVRNFWDCANEGSLFTWDDEFYKIKGIRAVKCRSICSGSISNFTKIIDYYPENWIHQFARFTITSIPWCSTNSMGLNQWR